MPESPEQNRSKVLSSSELLEEWKIVQAAQKDASKFGQLYSKYFPQIFKFVYRRTDNEQLTGDLTAQVFLKALQKIHTYTYKGVPFSAWLFRIASNEVVQHFRNLGKNRIVAIENYQVQEIISEDVSASKEDELKLMIQYLGELKEDEIQLIEMRFFEQRPFKEIAQIMELTENNTKVKTYRILERLRKKIIKK